MRNVSKIALSVAAALVGGSAFALPPGTVHDINLTVSGSSAFKGSFKTELTSVCNGTVDQYTATVSSGTAPDMVAYSCTLASTSIVPAAIQGKTALVYYRSEGGSVYGVGPLAKNTQVLRLKADNGCTGASPSYSCLTSAFDLAGDSGSGHLEKATTLLGVSDEEPAMFTGENWPALASESIFGAAPTKAELNNITSKQSAIGQAFAVYINSGVAGAGPVTISKQSLASIFNGNYTTWDQVPNAAGTGSVGTGDIVVCKRESGSGTQISAAMYFLGANCSPAAAGFVGSTVGLNGSTGTELSCISGNAGAIGYAAIQSAVPAGTAIINIDGVAPTKNNAALGNYSYWYEVSFNSGAALAGTTLEKSLASTMITRLKAKATAPTSASVFALPVGANASLVSFTNALDTSKPLSLGTRGGSSCANPFGQ